MTQRRGRAKRLILPYRGILPEGEAPAGERAISIRQRDFITHLDMLAAVADVAPAFGDLLLGPFRRADYEEVLRWTDPSPFWNETIRWIGRR